MLVEIGFESKRFSTSSASVWFGIRMGLNVRTKV